MLKDYFKQTDVPIVKHLVHFHCKCEEKIHDMFVHFCHGHPFGSTVLNVVDADDVVETKCFRKKKPANELCQYCITIRYSLNFRCHKICVEKLPDFMVPRVKSFYEYLKHLDCDSFFYFDKVIVA